MSTDSSTSRRIPDPLQMSAAEKCMAEWEARHDVAARGSRGDPEALQHYVARSRLGQPTRPHSPAAAGGQRQEHERSDPQPPAPPVPAQPRPRSGSWLTRLLRRSG